VYFLPEPVLIEVVAPSARCQPHPAVHIDDVVSRH